MNSRSALTLAAWLLFCFSPAATAANSSGLTVTLDQHSITVSGLSPGSTAVFFGVARVPMPYAYMNRIQRWAVAVDDAGHSGTATLDLQGGVPPASVWAVVDLRNAHYGLSSGPGLGLRQTVVANPLRNGPSQSVDHFAFDHGYLDLLYVHPGLGAWTWSAIGGTTSTNGGPRNSTIVSLSDGRPVGQSGAKPAAFLPGGVLIAIDFTRLEIAVIPVDQQLIGGAQ
ncbi:MAG TPA: hypothetical protein VLC46_27805 [Thermoanaerobaculia bacterium]|jgi:hypothetical protein|nr:hypothetical protein [Thermoanaerobaculia bacterium]